MNSNISVVGSTKLPSGSNKSSRDIKGTEQTFFDFINQSNSFVEQGSGTQNQVKESGSSTSRDYERNVYRNAINAKIKTENGTPQEIETKLQEAVTDVKAVLMDKFQVTEEELEEVLEVLGMQYVDLLNMEGFQEVVTSLLGTTENLELLLNPKFQEVFLNVNQIHSQLLKDLGITLEDLNVLCEGSVGKMVNDLLQTASDVQANEKTSQNVETELETDLQQEITHNQTISKQVSHADGTVGTHTNDALIEENIVKKTPEELLNKLISDEVISNEAVLDEVVSNEAVLDEVVSDEVVGSKKEELSTQDSKSQIPTKMITSLEEAIDKMQNAGQSKSEDTADQPNLFARNTPNNITMSQTSSTGFAGNFATMVDVKNLIDQITNSVKLQATPELTSMEMQLNPAHLGKLFLQVSSKDGIVTAQMAVETQAAKEALESQIVVLKEQMSQQGIKVEAVEVTIASHEFERNLEGNASQQQPEGEQAQEQSGLGRRNLLLNEMNRMEDDLTAEEKLVAQIMADNGNSVDMTA